ncbi:RluA family pseudouridine synthase [Verrucomicrobiota bacterium]
MNFEATTADEGKRLDVWLDGQLPDLSRSRIQALIKSGHITVDGRKSTAHRKVHPGMHVQVEVPPPTETALEPEPIPLDILHEDTDIIVINKPAGLVVHPAAGHSSGTLVNALLHHCPDIEGIGGERRPGIVHRLDKDTSGVMVVAKNDAAMAGITTQFKKNAVHKEYLAIVKGAPDPVTDTIRTLVGRSKHDRKKMSAHPPSGRNAVTHYETLETFAGCSLVKAIIETGRTHQIRVHMTHIGHPVLGDTQYGGKVSGSRFQVSGREDPIRIPRQMLHAHKLELKHPRTNKPLAFTAPIPPDMQSLLAMLRA